MRSLWFVLLGAVPAAGMTAWEALGRGLPSRLPSGSIGAPPPAASALADQTLARTEPELRLAAALSRSDLISLAALPGGEGLASDSELQPVRRSWSRWVAARTLIEEYLAMPRAESQADRERAVAVRHQWEGFQQKLQEAKLPGSDVLGRRVEQQIEQCKRQVARSDARSEAAAAATAVLSAWDARQFDQALARSRQWLATYSATADAKLAEQIQELQRRAEFRMEADRLRAELRSAADPAQREAAVAAFLDRFAQASPIPEPERQMLANCRRYLENLRAARAEQQQRQAAEQAIRQVLAEPPSGFDQRMAHLARLVKQHPAEAAKASVRAHVVRWLEEVLPSKQTEEPPGLQEAETGDGRLLRGYFRQVTAPDSAVGYKRYDTYEQYQRPTCDVGTWWNKDLASPPALSLPQRLTEQYNNQRNKLLRQPDQRSSWEEFATLCENLQSAWERYRVRPGASTETLSFRAEADVARQVLAGSVLDDLKTVWQCE